jgi:Domain of unknown function (DUF3303)
MKYVVSWTFSKGGSAQDSEASIARILAVFSKWSVPDGTVMHQFVGRVDGMGGFAVLETDDPASVALTCAKFAPYVEYQVYPVLDAEPSVAVMHEAAQFRDGIT